MADSFEAKRAIHDSLKSESSESRPVSEDHNTQRAADKARRQAEAELRVQAWEKRVADHQEAGRQIATLRSSDLWNTNPENRSRTYVSEELVRLQKIPGRVEELDGPEKLPPAVEMQPVQEPTVETSIIEVSDQAPEIPPELPVVEEVMPEALPVEPETVQEQAVELPIAEVTEPEPLPTAESAPVETAQEEPPAEVAEVLVPEVVEPAPDLPPELSATKEAVSEAPPVNVAEASTQASEVGEPSAPEVINKEIIAAPELAEEIPVGEYTEDEIDPDQLPDEDAETSEEVEDGLNNEQDISDSELRKEIEKNIADRRKETQKVMQELYSGLEELGNGEIQILEESFDSVAGIFHIFEEASFVMRDEQINQMTDELREDIYLLNDFKDSYVSEQSFLTNSRESLAGMTSDEMAEFMGGRAFQAEENENKARQIQAMLEEHLDRVIYFVQAYLDPRRAGNALGLAEDVKERFSSITRQVVEKRDKINETAGRLANLDK